jgi:hypothetical protein
MIRGVKKDLDTVERRNDRLFLGRWIARLSVGPVWGGQEVAYSSVIHDTFSNTASDARANHLVRSFYLGIVTGPFEFNAHIQIGVLKYVPMLRAGSGSFVM